MQHLIRSVAATLVVLAMTAGGSAAQDVGRYTGVVLGPTLSRQVWKPAVATSDRTGVQAGFYSDMPFPLGPLRVRVSGAYVQRGGLVDGDFDGEPIAGEVRSEWLTSGIEMKLARSIGPVHAFVAAGPSYGLHLRTKMDLVLGQVLFEEHASSFNLSASGGLGLTISDEWVSEIEARWVEGLTTARSGSFVKTRSRTLELMLRIGRVKPPS